MMVLYICEAAAFLIAAAAAFVAGRRSAAGARESELDLAYYEGWDDCCNSIFAPQLALAPPSLELVRDEPDTALVPACTDPVIVQSQVDRMAAALDREAEEFMRQMSEETGAWRSQQMRELA